MRTLTVDDLFESISNGLSVKQDKSGEGVPISRIETISSGVIDPVKVGYANLRIPGNERWILEQDDILFSHINSPDHVGKCALYTGSPSPLIHGMNLLRLRPRKTVIDPEYAIRLLRSHVFRSALQRFVNKAVNQASVSITNLQTIRAEIPSIAEQRRIAAILDHADVLRAKRREALAHLDALTQSIFLDMFEAELVARERVSLKSLTSLITKGTTPTSVGLAFTEAGVPFLRVQNLVNGTVRFSEGDLYIDEAAHSSLRRSTVKAGDLLVSIAGTVGRSAIVPSDAPEMNCNQAVAIIRPSEARFGPWMRAWLSTQDAAQQMRTSAVTATISNLSLAQLGALRVPVVGSPAVTEFSRRLSAVQQQASRLREAGSVLDALCASLQDRAFSGGL